VSQRQRAIAEQQNTFAYNGSVCCHALIQRAAWLSSIVTHANSFGERIIARGDRAKVSLLRVKRKTALCHAAAAADEHRLKYDSVCSTPDY
jgi:hypothetical protein